MSRSNHQPDPPKRQPREVQPELVDDPEPKTVTASGEQLKEWFVRDRRGEVHIHRMDVKDSGIYKLHLMWLHGRQLQTISRDRRETISEALELFK